jgi:hypothetical protein
MTHFFHPKLRVRLKSGGWQFQASPGKNNKTLSHWKKSWGVVPHTCHPSNGGAAGIKQECGLGWPTKKK